MAQAYTPGLKITDNEHIRKRRILPLKGEVLIEAGTLVQPEIVVARTLLPGKVMTLNIANKLGVDQSEVPAAMLKKEGDEIEEGEIIAEASSFFGLFKSEAKATLTGTIESISGMTGQVFLRGKPEPVEIKAYIEGKVTEVFPDEGVMVETHGAFMQGIFGIGGETVGHLEMAVTSPSEILDEAHIKPEQKGKIIIGGSLVTADALQKAIDLGVAGVVVGGFDDQDLRNFLGYDLGVAITGHETLGITLIVTEGFGQISMASKTFELLKQFEGKRASINGATQIRAGVIRPEVVIPMDTSHLDDDDEKPLLAMTEGSPLRIIRSPYFGKIGTVVDLPAEPRVLESGSKTRVVGVKLEETDETVYVPRANVEMIED
jgi:hypothetical protein